MSHPRSASFRGGVFCGFGIGEREAGGGRSLLRWITHSHSPHLRKKKRGKRSFFMENFSKSSKFFVRKTESFPYFLIAPKFYCGTFYVRLFCQLMLLSKAKNCFSPPSPSISRSVSSMPAWVVVVFLCCILLLLPFFPAQKNHSLNYGARGGRIWTFGNCHRFWLIIIKRK